MPLRLLLLAFMLLGVVCAAAREPGRPVIGINTDFRTGETGYTTVVVGANYVDAVLAAGGLPVLIPAVLSVEEAARYAELVDGFVFIGGADIAPARYGQEPHETTRIMSPRREDFDFALMEAALATRKPMLAICLGMQELNVALGGSMVQDIPAMTDSTLIHKGEGSGHEVMIEPGTRLHSIVGADRIAVNSMHHQACSGVPHGATIAARAPDGIVEAYELADHPFAIAVQWHPEGIQEQPEQRRLFEALVNASKQ